MMLGGGATARRPIGRTTFHVAVVLSVCFAIVAGAVGYWSVIEAPGLVSSPNDAAVINAARTVPRGLIKDRDGNVLASNKKDKNGESYRVYANRAFSQVIGYASSIYGRAGIELAYDAELTGLASDPVSDALAKFGASRFDPKDLTLSLSSDLQKAAVAALGKHRGAVVMLDPQTGEVLALASTPTYDASAIANPDTAKDAFAALQDDPSQPLLPRATLGRYVPGSVFKIVTAIAGLSSGQISPDTTFPEQAKAESNGLVVSGFRIHEHPGVPARTFDLDAATAWSSNVWFALAGLKTGGEELASVAGRMGFGAPLDFDLPTARSQVSGGGNGPGGFADDVELANASYGQAKTLVTPLQMALVASTVANGGVLMRPHLVTATTGRDGTRQIGPRELARVISPDAADAITNAMVGAVESDIGKQFTTGAAVPGIQTAGKSGTAELGGTGAPHSWFIGFAPADHPTVAIAVVVERGGRGGARAAPLAGDLMQLYFKLFR